MRECFFREEFWTSGGNKEEEAVIKEKIRSCVIQSTKQSQDNGGEERERRREMEMERSGYKAKTGLRNKK